MKKQYALSVSKPCTEVWEQFKPTTTGGFCGSCNKNVIDFTSMSDNELIEVISKSVGKTCGRLRPEQLNRSIIKPQIQNKINGWSMLKIGITSISLLLLNQNALTNPLVKPIVEVIQKEKQSKNKLSKINVSQIITGVVIDEYGDPLPGVNIILKGTQHGCISDINGKFKFPIDVKEGDVLVFAFIGFETKEYKVTKESFTNIAMEMTMTLNCVIMGEVAINEVYKSKTNIWSKLKSIF